MVANGGHDLRYDLMVEGPASLASGDISRMVRYSKTEETSASESQQRVEKAVRLVSEDVFAVVYAGLSCPRAGLDFATKVRAKSPASFIIVITCDCELDTKMELFDARQDAINALIVTPHCGGQGEMGEILEALIAQWPN